MGNNVQLSAVTLMGLAPDGTARPGADLDCIVHYDPIQSGCTGSYPNDTCFPGANLQWYDTNGTLVRDSVATSYYSSLGVCVDAFPITAPMTAGTYTATARSGNVGVAYFPFTVSGTDTDAGTVRILDVYCGNDPDSNASCDGSQLIIYFLRDVVDPGNGMAYVDIYIDGMVVAASVTVSTTGGNPAYSSYTTTCPNASTSHTILVRGQNGDGGASILLPATGGSTCQYYPCSAGCPNAIGADRCALCGIDCAGICVTNPCDDSCTKKPCTQCPSQTGCLTTPPDGDVSIIDQILAFIAEQPVVAVAGAGVLAYLLIRR